MHQAGPNKPIKLFYFSHANTPPLWATAPQYRGFTTTLWHTTVGSTPLYEWSANRRDLYLTTHNNHKRRTSMPYRWNSNSESYQASGLIPPCITSVKLSYFTVWRHTLRKNWVNCAVFTGSSAGFRTVISSRLSHTKLPSSHRESHSFLSLRTDTTMASSQGTSFSSNSFSKWLSRDIFRFKYHSLLHILRFLFFFSDNIMADVASKQQTTALFLSTIVTRTRHTELTKKLKNLMGNLCCAWEQSVQFFVQFFYTVKLHSLT